MPIYFAWFTTALLSVGGDANDQNLPQSGRLLYCVISGFPNISNEVGRVKSVSLFFYFFRTHLYSCAVPLLSVTGDAPQFSGCSSCPTYGLGSCHFIVSVLPSRGRDASCPDAPRADPYGQHCCIRLLPRILCLEAHVGIGM